MQNIHASRKNMHQVNIHASRKIMHRELIFMQWEDIHVSREKVMHCKRKFMHRRKKSCITRQKFLRLGNLMHIGKEFMHHEWRDKEIVYPSNINCVFFGKSRRQENYQDDIKRNVNTVNQLLFILTSKGDYIEEYIANVRHKLYLLYAKPIGWRQMLKMSN